MAPTISPDPKRSSTGLQLDSDRPLSTGRGGAGNFGHTDSSETDEDYSIPPIKTPIFTSGRGGTGNMQLNDPAHPEFARSMQDLEAHPPRPSNGEYHGVRGGAGNVFKPSEAEQFAAREYEERVKYDRSVPVIHERHDYRGWADKGKDFLFGRRRS